MNFTLNTLKTVLPFLFLVAAPQVVKAKDLDIKSCVEKIQNSWPVKTAIQMEGETRHDTDCALDLQIADGSLNVAASGSPLEVNFTLGLTDSKTEQTLQACKVDKEKLHLVFEEKVEGSFEKRNRIQMILLRREGKSLSMILSKREMKILRPVQQSNLICHLY